MLLLYVTYTASCGCAVWGDCAMILSLVNLLGCNPLFGLIALISAVAVGYRFLSFVSSLLDYSVVLSGERLLYQRTGTIRSEPR